MDQLKQYIHPQWWTSFFTGLIVDTQKVIYGNSEQTQIETEFIKKTLNLPVKATIADIPCGDGRHSVALAKLGYNLRGLDISPELIEAANQKTSTDVSAGFQVGDMLELPWDSELDGAFCFGNAFAYFDNQGNEKFLNDVFRALKPGGRFLLQTNLIAESILTKSLVRSWYSFGDTFFLHSPSYSPESAILTSEYTLIRGNQKEEKKAYYRIYQLNDLLKVIGEVGFRTLEVLGGMNGEPFKLGDQSLYLLVEK